MKRLGLLIALAAWPSAASAAQPTFNDLAPCAAAADRPVCLLKVAAGYDAGAALWRDEALRGRPDLLAAAAVTPERLEAWRRTDDGRTSALFFGPLDQADAAVDDVLARDAAGASPAEALARLQVLPARSPSLPPFFADSQLPSPRLLALSLLARPSSSGFRRQPSTALRRAALAAWEAELAAATADAALLAGAGALAEAYAAVADEAGVAQALALEPRLDRRIKTLLELGRLEDAATAAAALTPQELAPARRAELEALSAAHQEAAARATAHVAEMAAELRNKGDADLAKIAEAVARQARRETPARPAKVSESEVMRQAAADVLAARLEVVRQAVAAKRPEVARGLADQILATPRDLETDEVRQAMGDLAAAATPERATAWVEPEQAALDRQLARGGESMDVQGRIIAVAAGWRALGRNDRIEALVARLKPVAQRERALRAARPREAIQTPAAWQLTQLLLSLDRPDEARALGVAEPSDLLRDDIKKGRGVARLDAYLAETPEGERYRLLITCASESARPGAFANLPLCYDRSVSTADTPARRYLAAQSALRDAGFAARMGETAVARHLLELALREGPRAVEAEPGLTQLYSGLDALALIEIAKAELRADGRLPKSPPPPSP